MTKQPEARRTEVIEVGVTQAEKDEIVQAAQSEGMNTSTFVRVSAIRVARGEVADK